MQAGRPNRASCRKYGRDQNVWDKNVAYFLLSKSDPDYYHDGLVFYEYCRGDEPYRYVNDIHYRFELYLNVIED